MKRTRKQILDELARTKDRLRDYRKAGDDEGVELMERDIKELEEELERGKYG